MQKVDYVVFMQKKVAGVQSARLVAESNSEDYGPPNGYRPKADREAEELLKKAPSGDHGKRLIVLVRKRPKHYSNAG